MSEILADTVLVEVDAPPAAYESPKRLWTEEDDNILARKWNQGWSTRLIACELRRSRNSIIGRAKREGARLGLMQRKSGWPEDKDRPKPRKMVSKRDKAPPMVLMVPSLETVPAAPIAAVDPTDGTLLLELADGQCRWSINDPPKGGEYLFCKDMAVANSSYCACHTRRAWVKYSGWGMPERSV